jgi:DNA-binding transcriptional MerR regulator
MLTIGDLAHRTGVSRRMLRHWEAEGLLVPAAVDPSSGYRRYQPAQVGRVHAIAALRSLGFGLEQIGDLLDPRLTTGRLLEVLRAHEQELAVRVAADQASLAEVRRRLRSIERGLLMTTQTLQLHPLPARRLARLATEVSDESEIGHAVDALGERLRALLGGGPLTTLVRTYDARPDDGPIEVAVAVEVADGEDPPAGLDVTDLPAAPRGASISYDQAVESEADAWLALDAALEPYGLATTSAYRVLVTPSTLTLQAAVIQAGCR